MPRMLALLVAAWMPLAVANAEEPAKPANKERTVEELAEAARKSVVVITVKGRDGKREGIGTGFVVSADGLIATNLHVIGEGRAITVELADGTRHEATAVHASDRSRDLAVLRIKGEGLTPLELGDSSKLKDGQAVVALGNPQGLKHSVVAGVVSGRREVEGRPMIQVAIPVEPGNSGGPLLDMSGRVQGIVSIKSLVTANLAFAEAINSLKPLLARPNPVPMTGWLTIGVLDPEEWQTRFGGRWRQRAGRILVDGAGSGFGNRSLCLWQKPMPELPFEVAVTVRLDDEKGAAGLVFHADGGDKHYGFYPSNGRLRLTRFDGPDVFSWHVLKEEASPHYRLGDWNTLKVRLEKDRIRCYVNDHLVMESTDAEWTEGKVGLAKFRDTSAAFKGFRVGKELRDPVLSPEIAARISKAVEGLKPSESPKAELIDQLRTDGPASLTALRDRARLLEQQAVQLRQLAQTVHQQTVLAELAKAVGGKEADVDLVHAALLIARLDNEEVDVNAYRGELERMARKLVAGLPKDADDEAKLAALNKFLFTERGFHGSRGDYYNRSNSYLNEVLDDREGIPITLSVIYLELARRLGMNVAGVSLPGHFVVQHRPAKGDPQLIDVYEGGKPLSREEAAKKAEAITGRPLRDEDLAPVGEKAILVRMLHNLLRVARDENDLPGTCRYLDAVLTVNPEAGEERGLRAGLRFQAGDKEGALKDVDWLLEHQPEGIDLDRLRQLRRLLMRPEK
jgi:serine protease Do